MAVGRYLYGINEPGKPSTPSLLLYFSSSVEPSKPQMDGPYRVMSLT